MKEEFTNFFGVFFRDSHPSCDCIFFTSAHPVTVPAWASPIKSLCGFKGLLLQRLEFLQDFGRQGSRLFKDLEFSLEIARPLLVSVGMLGAKLNTKSIAKRNKQQFIESFGTHYKWRQQDDAPEFDAGRSGSHFGEGSTNHLVDACRRENTLSSIVIDDVFGANPVTINGHLAVEQHAAIRILRLFFQECMRVVPNRIM